MDNGILVLAGPPCAGKSSVGKVLATDSSVARIYIEIDSLFSLLLPKSDRNRSERMLAYDAAHALARMLIGRGQAPILECTYSRLQQRASLLNAIADIPALPLRVVEFFVSPEDAVHRFRRRHQATDLDDHLVRVRAETYPYSDQALRLVSSASTPGEMAHQITAWLQRQPRAIQRDRWAAAGKGWD